MLISGVVSNQYQVRLATLGQPLAVQPEYNLFSADLALYWGSPKLGSVAVGPVFFTDYGNEPAVVRLAPQLSLSQQVVEENRPAGVIGQTDKPTGSPRRLRLITAWSAELAQATTPSLL